MPSQQLVIPVSLRDAARAQLAFHSDFPKPGIVFCDVLPLFRAPQLCSEVLSAVAAALSSRFPGLAFIAGLESRGFLLLPLALSLGLPFVALRKAGKLPGRTVRQDYALEYGTATLEAAEGCVAAGARGLVVDDLLATGGSAAAAKALLERLGATVAGVFVLVELSGLGGAARAGAPVASLFCL
jgi:adenine phosphoribosyltransferase